MKLDDWCVFPDLHRDRTGDLLNAGAARVLLVSLLLILLVSAPRAEGIALLGRDLNVVGLYQPSFARASDGRTAVQLLKGMKTDFLMRGYFKWGPSSQLDYRNLKASINQLKRAMPKLVFEGGIAAQYIVRGDTWANGSRIEDSDFNKMLGRDALGNPVKFGDGFIPDLASPLYRQYLAKWSEKQVDAGVDAIFFDGVYLYARYLFVNASRNWSQVAAEYSSYFTMVTSEIKSYASSRGRQLLITINNNNADNFNALWPPVTVAMEDFVTLSFELGDFVPPFNLQEDWATIRSTVTSKMGRDVPIIAFIDWAGDQDSQMYRFGRLSTTDQITVLTRISTATKTAGVLFAYPILGGNIGSGYGVYDSVKYGTYDTIVALATGSSSPTALESVAMIIASARDQFSAVPNRF